MLAPYTAGGQLRTEGGEELEQATRYLTYNMQLNYKLNKSISLSDIFYDSSHRRTGGGQGRGRAGR